MLMYTFRISMFIITNVVYSSMIVLIHLCLFTVD